jgi:hypothetical protein
VFHTCIFLCIKTCIYIYPIENQISDDLLKYNTYNNKTIFHEFYDIYNIKKTAFEEFEVSIPNKIEKVLLSYDFDLDYIVFTNNNNNTKKIIEEIEIKPSITTIIKENINKFISVIKPFIYD